MVAAVVMAVAEEDTVVGDLVEAMQVDLVEDIMVVGTTEGTVVDMEDITEGTEVMPGVMGTAIEDILTTIPTTLTGIGLLSVIPMVGATESGCHIIEGEGYFLLKSCFFLVVTSMLHFSW